MKSIALVVSTILTLCQLSPTLQNETSTLSTKTYDLAPLYLIQPNFLTTSATDHDVIKYLTKNGFQQKTTLGFVAKNSIDCNGNATMIPVYRFKNDDTQNYLFLTNHSLSAGTTLGYTMDGIAFYVSPTPNEHCGPTLLLHSYWAHTHYVYTNMNKTSADKILVENEGGEYKGIVCHIWLNDEAPVATTNCPVNRATVTAEISLPNGHSFVTGSEISITCNVGGFPVPTVTWYKNDVKIVADNRIQIIDSPHQLIITGTRAEDAGFYKCAANNNITGAHHAEEITVNDDYTDHPYFANCDLVVKHNYCRHTDYVRFCSKSCTLAGQQTKAENQK